MARAEVLKVEFSDLSQDEAEDLAKLSRESLWIYRRSILGIERSILENRLPRTIQALKTAWKNYFHQPLDLAFLLKRSQLESCWEGYLTSGLMISFQKALQGLYPELCNASPDICELLEYERIVYEVKRAPNDKPSCENAFDPEFLGSLGIEEIAGSQIRLASGSRIFKPKHLHEEFVPGASYWIIRTSNYLIKTIQVDSDFADLLSEHGGCVYPLTHFLIDSEEIRLRVLMSAVISGAATLYHPSPAT